MPENVIPFPGSSDSDPLDDEVMVSIAVNGKGDIDILINSFCETAEQHNWLIAKIAEASARIVDRKKEFLR